mgnify:CR=1 FL=1
MADSYWARIAKNAAQEFIDTVEKSRESTRNLFFQLVEAVPPEERRAQYQQIDWEKLRQFSPELWAKLSQDALAIEEREQKKRFDALKEWENRQYVEAAAFRPQLTPYGYLPNSPGAQSIGLTQPLPLLRYGE